MKKYPKYQLRVSEEMLSALVVAGPDVVRGWLEAGLWGGSVSPVKVVDAVVRDGVVVPAWKAKMERQQVEREAREASSVLFGSAAPSAVASVSAPRSVVFQQSEAERARRMALARSAATRMKMQPQMPPNEDFDAQGDPEPPEE